MSVERVSLTQLPESLNQWRSQLVEAYGQFSHLLVTGTGAVIAHSQTQESVASLVILGKSLTPGQVVQLAQIAQQNGVRELAIKAPVRIADTSLVVLSLSNLPAGSRQVFEQYCQDMKIDFALVEALPTIEQPGVLVMDMDSTAIQIECIDEIAKLAGVGEQVAAVTAQAMQGKLDFAQSLRQRVATLKGAPESILAQVLSDIPLMPGLELLVRELKQAGWVVAIASGGFTYFADSLKQRLGLDAAVSNTLGIENGQLTGEVIGDIIDAERKAQTVNQLAREHQLPPLQRVAVGDGANDLRMMSVAGLGVAIHAKPIVRAQADVALNFHDLEGVLALLSAQRASAEPWA